jgi:hypothetical protein
MAVTRLAIESKSSAIDDQIWNHIEREKNNGSKS